jgi:N-acetylmuramoyl-L-alanine amidase
MFRPDMGDGALGCRRRLCFRSVYGFLGSTFAGSSFVGVGRRGLSVLIVSGLILCLPSLSFAPSFGLAHAASPSPVKSAADRFDRVVIDAGHGGHDEGATGPSGLREKNLVLDVAKLLAERLSKRGIAVVMTRTVDEFLSLEERTAVANDAKADLFLSIHANASSSRKPAGIETYFASLDATDDHARATAERENSAFGPAAPRFGNADPLAAILGDLIESQHLQESSEFAKIAQNFLASVDRAPSRGVKQAPFVVLMGVQMPASLVEIGFLTNPEDEKFLRRPRQREDLADALADAVMAFAKRYDARRGVRPALTRERTRSQ